MTNCQWHIEPTTGDHVLIKNGVECGRIVDGENTRRDEGTLGSPTMTLDELKKQLEEKCDCCNSNDI